MGNGVAADASRVALNPVPEESDTISPQVKTLRRGSIRSSKPGLRSNGSRRFARWITPQKFRRHSPKACQKDEKDAAWERCIKQTNDFKAVYRLGREVIRLSKPGSQLRYATRISDGVEVVVKICYKNVDGLCAFSSSDDEKEWRETMLRVLDLPPHPGIVRTHCVLEDSSAYYVVMERVAGLDLYEVLRRERLDAGDARAVLQQLLSALAVLHSRGLIHKDLKLENVMLERGGNAKAYQVGDVVQCRDTGGEWRKGVVESLHPLNVKPDGPEWPSGYEWAEVRRIDEAVRAKLIDFETLTLWSSDGEATRDVLGTDQYIAPEAYAGWYSPASDMFAVGVLAYHLLTGKYPFDAALFDDKPGENIVGNTKMEAIRDRLSKASISWSHDAFQSDFAARRLWTSMLAVDTKLRPTALEALADPWFSASISDIRSEASRTSANGGPALTAKREGSDAVGLFGTMVSDVWSVPVPPQPDDALTFVARALSSAHELDIEQPRLGSQQEDIGDILLPPGCVDSNC